MYRAWGGIVLQDILKARNDTVKENSQSAIVVSDDERFFRSAFDVIWKPRGKVLESAAGFAARLQNIVAR